MTEDALIEEVELTTDASDSLSILSNSDNDKSDNITSLSSDDDRYNNNYKRNNQRHNNTTFKSDTTLNSSSNQVDDSSISKSDVSITKYSKHHQKNLLKTSSKHYDRNNKSNNVQQALLQRTIDTGDTSTTKRKKKRAAICLTNCRYDVVRRTAARFGMREVSETDNWDLYWTDLSISIERAKDMRRFQRVNHFPGMLEICRKDLLARNLNRMLRIFPKDYGFFPKTWCLPAEYVFRVAATINGRMGEALAYSRLRKNRTYILKPDAGSQGRGIFLTRSLKDLKPNDRMICQVYLSRPFLIDGFKFDLRVYTLITSCDPLRIYVYNEGLARFATSRYREPTGNNTTNVFMHLTNYAVNKHSRTYNMNDEGGSKRKISSLNRYLVAMGYDVQELWQNIDEVIVKTIIAAWPILKHSYHACFPSHDLAYACFELLGFDVLLDHKLKPYILEVNHSPSFHCDTVIDSEVKSNLLFDTFSMLDIARYDKRKVLEEDRRRVRERLLQGVNKDLGYTDSIMSTSNTDPWIMQDKWESMHLGDFRQAYPGTNQSKYAPFFRQTQSSLYCQTAASRARDTAARIHRQEMETKAKLEASKRVVTSNKQDIEKEKVRPESPLDSTTTNNNNSKQQNTINSTVSQQIKARKHVGPNRSVLASVCNSFLPGTILESEERERIAGLAQRDLLIRNYGLLQQIYFAMKMNGSLRMDDQKKYAQYTNMNNISTNNKIHDGQKQLSSNISKKNSIVTSQNNKQLTNEAKNLEVGVNEAHIYERPHYEQITSIAPLSSNNLRSTRTQVARSLINTVRIIGNNARNDYQTIKPHQIHGN